MRKLSLTSDEIRAGIRRAADSPRLKYLAKATDGRRDFVTAAVIKRALAYAAEDGVLLDPMSGFVLADQTGASAPKPRRGRKKRSHKKAPESPATASDSKPTGKAPPRSKGHAAPAEPQDDAAEPDES